MSLSRRHFEQFAFMLRKYNAERQNIDVMSRPGERMTYGNERFDLFVKDIARYFASENPAFSDAMFKYAVYPDGIKYPDHYYKEYQRACAQDAILEEEEDRLDKESSDAIWQDVTP